LRIAIICSDDIAARGAFTLTAGLAGLGAGDALSCAMTDGAANMAAPKIHADNFIERNSLMGLRIKAFPSSKRAIGVVIARRESFSQTGHSV
jgi:hypothetical protein